LVVPNCQCSHLNNHSTGNGFLTRPWRRTRFSPAGSLQTFTGSQLYLWAPDQEQTLLAGLFADGLNVVTLTTFPIIGRMDATSST
ncbi:hypothetical protein CI238_06968, partial [Colletotrichum incanum]